MPSIIQYGEIKGRTDIKKATLFAEFFPVFSLSRHSMYCVCAGIDVLESSELSEPLVASFLMEIDTAPIKLRVLAEFPPFFLR